MTVVSVTTSNEDRGPAWRDHDTSDRSGEVWLPVVGFDGYGVSDHGRVRSLDRVVVHKNGFRQSWPGRVMKQSLDRDGYPRLSLQRDGRTLTRHVHSLVLESFVGPRPEGLEACHNDGDSTNNVASNIRWDTKKNNTADQFRHGTFRNPTWNGDAPPMVCGRGHALAGENLIPSALRQGGGRACLACNRARARVRPGRAHHGRDFQTVSDEAYQEIVDAAGTTHAELLAEAEEYVPRRLEQLSRHSNPADRSETAGDTSGSRGDTYGEEAA